MSQPARSANANPAHHESVDPEVQKNLRHNYWVTVVEGGAFMAGMTFINANTLLPEIIRQLGGSPLLISLMPTLMGLGFLAPSVLTAHWIDRMPRFYPIVSFMGIFQRLPFLAAAIALFFATEGSTTLTMVIVAAAPLMSGIMGGISATAWQQLVARCIPGNRRASLFAHRYIIACVSGVVAGWVVTWLLHNLPPLRAYAVLHLIAFMFLAFSMAVFMMTREPRSPLPARASLTLWENLRLMPKLVIDDKPFRRYLASRLLRNGTFILAGFLAIYARESLNLPESFLGYFLIAQMTGAILGSLTAARIGDRAGGKIVTQIGVGLFCIMAAWSIVAASPWAFLAIFFLFGLSLYVADVGTMTLMLEIVPLQKRSTYLALISLVNIPGMLGASLIAATLWKRTGSITWIAVATIITLGGSMLLLQPVREPRHAALAPAQPATEPPAEPD